MGKLVPFYYQSFHLDFWGNVTLSALGVVDYDFGTHTLLLAVSNFGREKLSVLLLKPLWGTWVIEININVIFQVQSKVFSFKMES